MSRTVERIHRLRWLLEEASRLELENLVEHAVFLESAREKEAALISSGRIVALSAIAVTTDDKTADAASTGNVLAAANEMWTISVIDEELAQRREKRLEGLAQLAARNVAACREEMLFRRKERLQIEVVLRNNEALAKRKLERRQQRDLDDWFAARRERRNSQ
jgi:hypothetical protein